jgi:hypothetical protein
MPPPHSFWVILIGKTPTSFRGKGREDLVPTLRQLQRTQSDVTLRWFERGKMWESPEAAIGAARLAATAAREKRTKEWRPGGEHRDPKARFELTRDQKRAKFKRDQSAPDRGERERPPRDARGDDRPQSPFGPREPRAPRVPRPDRPWSDRPKFDRPGPGRSPFGDRSRSPRGDSRDRPPSGDRPFGSRPPRSDKSDRRDRREPPGPQVENPFKDRPRSDRPAPRPDRPASPGRPDRRPDVRPTGRSDRRPSSGRPGRPSGPPGDRGGFKPPKRRS